MMMHTYIEQYKEWFNGREKREKILVFVATWAIIYGLFSILLFNSIDHKNEALAEEVSQTQKQITKSEDQLKFLSEIPSTPIYKDWLAQNAKFESLKKQYAALLSTPTKNRWSAVIRTILESHPHIHVESIEQLPEAAYSSNNNDNKTTANIYQQQMKMTVSGNFEDIISYLQSLEKTLFNIHWKSLDYKVTNYPSADVTMEFSILYEKNN